MMATINPANPPSPPETPAAHRRSTRKREAPSPVPYSPPAKRSSPGKPFRCPVCSQDYVRAAPLQQHLSKKHNVEVSVETVAASKPGSIDFIMNHDPAVLGPADTNTKTEPTPSSKSAAKTPATAKKIEVSPAKGKKADPFPAKAQNPSPAKSQKSPAKSRKKTEEKRPKRFRPSLPKNLEERLYRCKTQKMFVLDRFKDGKNPLEETFKMAGSTGNVYTVRICSVPSCDCPDGQKNGTCKHILYIMSKVLKARDDLVYQAGLLSSELEYIFEHAPPPASSAASTRKPLEQDDCPICYSPFEPNDKVVWCRAQCGTNFHEKCFAEWARTKGQNHVTCVMCREPWKEDESVAREKVQRGEAKKGEDGYQNVAGELGLSGVRDTSTYFDPESLRGRVRWHW